MGDSNSNPERACGLLISRYNPKEMYKSGYFSLANYG